MRSGITIPEASQFGVMRCAGDEIAFKVMKHENVMSTACDPNAPKPPTSRLSADIAAYEAELLIWTQGIRNNVCKEGNKGYAECDKAFLDLVGWPTGLPPYCL